MTQQEALPLKWPQRYGHDDFIVADCNKEAFNAVISPDEWPIPITLLIGDTGSGKTHLSKIFQQKHEALSLKDAQEVEQALSSHALFIVVDNADKIKNDEALFHLFNSALTRKARLLMTAKAEPQNWIKLPDLLSRMKASHYIKLQNPDEKMIKSAYQKLFNDRGLFVDEKVLDYLAMRTERSFPGLLKNVNVLDALALKNKKRVTIPLITESNIFN